MCPNRLSFRVLACTHRGCVELKLCEVFALARCVEHRVVCRCRLQRTVRVFSATVKVHFCNSWL